MRRSALLLLTALTAPALFAAGRITSDFEIATVQKQLERERDPISRAAALLNLGDLYASRRQTALASRSWSDAASELTAEREAARRRSDLNSYAIATGYFGLSMAKLGRGAEAFDSLEEAQRYASDSAKSWNLYSSAMTVLGKRGKAISAARNAVDIASRSRSRGPTAVLDLRVYQYSLASALLAGASEASERREAERLLETILESLDGSELSSIRQQVESGEQFEVLSSVRGDAAAYLSLRNRARLRLAALLESENRTAAATTEYRRALDDRTDDPTALAAMARSGTGAERQRYFAASFEANPFSLPLIRQYESYLSSTPGAGTDGDSPGALMRRGLEAHRDRSYSKSSEHFAALARQFPDNDILRFLIARNEAESGDLTAARKEGDRIASSELRSELAGIISSAESQTADPPAFLVTAASAPTVTNPSASDLARLSALLRAGSLTPPQRTRLDSLVFSSRVTFDPGQRTGDTTVFAAGSVAGIRFRFSNPTAFRGSYTTEALLLEYRILGVTSDNGAEALLVEPIRVVSS